MDGQTPYNAHGPARDPENASAHDPANTAAHHNFASAHDLPDASAHDPANTSVHVGSAPAYEPAPQQDGQRTYSGLDFEQALNPRKARPTKGAVVELFEWIEMLSVALVIVVLVFSFVCRVVSINGPSMTPTLLDGDRVVVTNFMYTPEVGDVIVVAGPGQSEPYIKRIIALEGQTVDFDLEKKQLLVDGQLIEEPYINEQMQDFYWYSSTRFPYTVPEDHVFFMGDNRNHSVDSRFEQVGSVDSRHIIGQAVFRLFPFRSIGVVK